MRVITRVTQLANARWTPCVALVIGSLLFVSLAIIVIPDRIGSMGLEVRDRRTFTVPGAVANDSLPDPASPVRAGSPSPASPPLPAGASPHPNGNSNALVGSLFGSTPAMELPVAPPDPAPPPPPAEVPPPAPTPSIFELPAPPPPAAPAPSPPAGAPAPGAAPASAPEANAPQGQ
jgi:hypothetical protein